MRAARKASLPAAAAVGSSSTSRPSMESPSNSSCPTSTRTRPAASASDPAPARAQASSTAADSPVHAADSVTRRPRRSCRGSFEVALEARQHFDRMRGIRTDPTVVNLLDRHDVQHVPPDAAFASRHDELGALEHAHMLHHRASVEGRKVRAELASRARRLAEQIEDAPPGGMSKRTENAVLLVESSDHVIVI